MLRILHLLLLLALLLCNIAMIVDQNVLGFLLLMPLFEVMVCCNVLGMSVRSSRSILCSIDVSHNLGDIE